MLTVGSLFSGIGGFDEGFRRAGFPIRWQCEQEPFCLKVLMKRFPDTDTIVKDVRGLDLTSAPAVDVLVGGFPCQDLSVAGKRAGLEGIRSGLFFEFVRVIAAFKPSLWVIENVPGFLSSAGGRDFATALFTLDECGYVGGWRILDSQYFGLAQRRERVFLVGGIGRFRECAQQILFESAGGDRDSATGDEARPDVAATLRGRSSRPGVNEPGRGGEDDANLVAYTLRDNQRNTSQGPGNYIAATLNSGGHDGGFRTEPGEHLAEVARTLTGSMFKRHDEDTDTLIASPLTASMGHHGHSSPRGDGRDNLVWALGCHSGAADADVSNRSHAAGGPSGMGISEGAAHSLRAGRTQSIAGERAGVRRLTPLECERLQGFPDGWTCLCGYGAKGSQFCRCSDTPRYKALGNAVSVPVAEWIARRILELGT